MDKFAKENTQDCYRMKDGKRILIRKKKLRDALWNIPSESLDNQVSKIRESEMQDILKSVQII